jgi:hypothetical protein
VKLRRRKEHGAGKKFHNEELLEFYSSSDDEISEVVIYSNAASVM